MARRTTAKANRTPVPTSEARDKRAIRWNAWDLDGLDEAGRVKAGKSWASRMRQEHLAVGAFAMLVTEIAAEGCEPVVLSLLTRASSDEVRHTEICRRMAAGLLGEERVPKTVRGVPSIPKHPEAKPHVRSLRHVVEMCCLSETFTGVYLTEMLSRMSRGTPKMAVESLLEDEIDHGRVGWAFLASRARDGRLEGLSEAIPAMLDRTMGWVMDAASSHPEADEPALAAVGYLGTTTGAAIFRKTLRDVILPGFEACRVALGPTREHVATRGWI